MKKLVLASLMCLLSSSAFACGLMVSTTPDVRNVAQKNGGYPVSDEKCELLNKAGMTLQIDASASVVVGVNVGTASVRIAKDGVVSSDFGRSISVNTGLGSQDVADERMLIALKEAVESLDFDKGIKQVKERTAYLTKKR